MISVGQRSAFVHEKYRVNQPTPCCDRTSGLARAKPRHRSAQPMRELRTTKLELSEVPALKSRARLELIRCKIMA
jgi:hypothetical protein